MNQIDNIEKRLSAIEAILNAQYNETPTPGPTPDPYLVPGAPCEVFDDYDDEGPSLAYFSMLNKNNKPLFTLWKPKVGEEGDLYDHYRVLGTVWDHAPEWAEWVATDSDGEQVFFRLEPSREHSAWTSMGDYRVIGHRADPADWKNSLRRRPEWARRKG